MNSPEQEMSMVYLAHSNLLGLRCTLSSGTRAKHATSPKEQAVA